jgi:hypothetical protein
VERVKQESELECVPLCGSLRVNRDVLLAKGSAGIPVIAKSSEQPVEHPLMTLGRWRYACSGIHCREGWLKHATHNLTVGFCLQADPVDHEVQDSEREGEAVVVAKVGVPDRVAPTYGIKWPRMEKDAQAPRQLPRPNISV